MKTRRITHRKSKPSKVVKSSRPRHTKQSDIFLVRAPEYVAYVPTAHAPSTIFQSLTARAVSVVLILFFVFVPLGDAYADTSEVIQAEDASIAVEDPTVVTEEPESVGEEIAPEVLKDTETEVVEVMSSVEGLVTSEDVSGEVDDISVETLSADEIPDTSTSSTEPPLEVVPLPQTASAIDAATTTTGTVSEEGTTIPSEEVATTTEEVISVPELPPVVPETTATSTETVIEEVVVSTTTEVSSEVVTSTHTTDADRFSFSTTECVPVGNGAFHCVRTADQGTAETDRGDLYAAQDAEGDLEIYLNNGEQDVPITENTYDDDAPSLDQRTGDVVWHALIDDRYQVMQYERDSGAITRLTKETYNSMQPASYAGAIVFQAWVDNDWEIVLIDEEGKTVLTENDVHDIAPSINERYIMWQSHEGIAWVAKVYDRTTKDIETVEGIEGGMVENPRMVMVFDNKKENGDVETIGYNPESGETVSLVATPVKLPEKIPAPEEKQEEKALVGSTLPKIETKTENAGDASGDGNDTATSTPNIVGDESVVVVEPAASTTPAVVPLDTSASSTIDMSVPVVEEAPAIEDLVVPSFESMSHGTTTEQS